MPVRPQPEGRCKHTRVKLVTEGPLYGIWLCKSCGTRHVRGTPQLSLFSLGEAQMGGRQLELGEAG